MRRGKLEHLSTRDGVSARNLPRRGRGSCIASMTSSQRHRWSRDRNGRDASVRAGGRLSVAHGTSGSPDTPVAWPTQDGAPVAELVSQFATSTAPIRLPLVRVTRTGTRPPALLLALASARCRRNIARSAALRDAGWEVVRQKGSHEVWARPGESARIVVAGKESATVPAGTLSSIRRASGLDHLR